MRLGFSDAWIDTAINEMARTPTSTANRPIRFTSERAFGERFILVYRGVRLSMNIEIIPENAIRLLTVLEKKGAICNKPNGWLAPTLRP